MSSKSPGGPKRSADPETLFHYTSAQGLLGILEPCSNALTDMIPDRAKQGSFQLWATDARFLNDRAELTHAAGAIADKVEQTMGKGNMVDDLIDKIRRADFSTHQFGVPGQDQSTFVTCFSAAKDSLSQWRGYAGGGYAIEFFKAALDQMVFPLADGTNGPLVADQPKIQRVDYLMSRTEIAASAARIVDEYLAPGPYGFMAVAANEVARFKHRAFSGEQEYRQFVSRPSALLNLKFRFTSTGLMIPYVVTMSGHPTMQQPIKAVWIGPSPDAKLRKKSVQLLLEQRGVRYPVKISKAPYRG